MEPFSPLTIFPYGFAGSIATELGGHVYEGYEREPIAFPERYRRAGSHCEKKLVTNGYAWSMLVWLDLTRGSRTQEQSASLLNTTKAINEELKLKKFNPSKDRLWLTVTGVLRTHKNLATHIRQGFGHMNGAPAEIIVQIEEDALIEPGGLSKPLRGNLKEIAK